MKADIKEYNINSSVLEVLLKDQTSGRNLIWGTSDYSFPDNSQILFEQVIDGHLIKPRFVKQKETIDARQKTKGEVFTPLEIIKKQNDIADANFSGNWSDYIRRTVLEITCGEAPYLVNRYDVVTGEVLLLRERQGLLDRKLARVSENTETEQEWKENAHTALKTTYGYEWQGDSLLIARENVLETWKDYYFQKFPNGCLAIEEEIEVATIISHNLFQMDGVSCLIPYSNTLAKIMNWDTNKQETFKSVPNEQLSLFEK